MRIFGEVLLGKRLSLFPCSVGNVARPAWQLAEQLAIDHRISRMGWVSDGDYPWVLGCADICICPLEDSLNDRARWPTKILKLRFFDGWPSHSDKSRRRSGDAFSQKSDVGDGYSDGEFAAEIVALFHAPGSGAASWAQMRERLWSRSGILASSRHANRRNDGGLNYVTGDSDFYHSVWRSSVLGCGQPGSLLSTSCLLLLLLNIASV